MALTRKTLTGTVTCKALARARAAGRALVTRKTIAAALTLIGGAAATTGIALIYVPAALIVGGVALTAFALLAVDVDPPKAPR